MLIKTRYPNYVSVLISFVFCSWIISVFEMYVYCMTELAILSLLQLTSGDCLLARAIRVGGRISELTGRQANETSVLFTNSQASESKLAPLSTKAALKAMMQYPSKGQNTDRTMSSCHLIFKLEQETDKLKMVIFRLYFRVIMIIWSDSCSNLNIKWQDDIFRSVFYPLLFQYPRRVGIRRRKPLP